eukprot:TRINITY_DN24986_c0_g1_i1.p1 TRINITY_DN24986_c0_g1~~TRINITY_DN24986_c0_g1_i1.p1  ORF type:complete len:428 (+),score=90.66 TRINITY_DN24986_c0_g1_i1:42-1286(+)
MQAARGCCRPGRGGALLGLSALAAAGMVMSQIGAPASWSAGGGDAYALAAAAAVAVAVGGDLGSHDTRRHEYGASPDSPAPPRQATPSPPPRPHAAAAGPPRVRQPSRAAVSGRGAVDGRIEEAQRLADGAARIWQPPDGELMGTVADDTALAWRYDSRRRSWASIPRRGTAPAFDHREALATLVERWGSGEVTGVEVGVRWGEFSTVLLRKCRNLTLYMVDPWIAQENYTDLVNIQTSRRGNELLSGEQMYKYVALKMARAFGDRARVLRMFGAEAAAHFRNSSVDFVYIDARHDFKAVTEDLVAWWPKLRPGGVMSGHDYFYGNDTCVTGTDQDWTLQSDGTRDWRGVRGAVEEFVHRQGHRVTTMIVAGHRVGKVLTTQWVPLSVARKGTGRKRRCVPFPSWLFIKTRGAH